MRNQEEKLSYREKYIEELVLGTSIYLTARPPFYVIFGCFLRLHPAPTQETYLLNASYKDT